MLGSVRHKIVVEHSAQKVWERIGDPADLAQWIPDFECSTVEGATRTITTNSGFSFSEELLIVDPILRRIEYRLDLPILKYHLGTLDVIEIDDASCVIAYATDTDPRIMALVIAAPTFRGLLELKRQLEESK